MGKGQTAVIIICLVVLAAFGGFYYGYDQGVARGFLYNFETTTYTVNTTPLIVSGYIVSGYLEQPQYSPNITATIWETRYYNGDALPGELGHKCIGFYDYTENGTPIKWVSTTNKTLLSWR